MAIGRMIKETIRTSKTVNAMTDFQFRAWVYLITYADDYGRGSADPEILKGFVFPRLKRLRESDIEKTLAELADLGSIQIYSVDSEPYFCFPNWGDHQRIQQKQSKFPPPAESHGESPCNTVIHGESPLEVEVEVKEVANATSAQTADAASAASEPPMFLFPLVDGSEYPLLRQKVEQWKPLFPAIDVEQQIRLCLAWNIDNPRRRKTKEGILRHINTWLTKAQNNPSAADKFRLQQNSGGEDKWDWS